MTVLVVVVHYVLARSCGSRYHSSITGALHILLYSCAGDVANTLVSGAIGSRLIAPSFDPLHMEGGTMVGMEGDRGRSIQE